MAGMLQMRRSRGAFSGFLLMVARGRHTALFGALLAAAAGAWFALGTVLSPLWNHHVPMGGSPASSTVYMRIMEQLGFFTALGVVIVFVAAAALGRIASVASGIREIEEIPETTVPADTVPVQTVRTEETRPVHTRLLPRRKTEDTNTQTVG